MKKLLKGTAAHGVLGAMLGGAFIAAAPVDLTRAEAGVTVSVNGFVRQRIGFATNRDGHADVGNRVDVDSQSDSEIHFNARSELDNGIKLRAHVELDANNQSDIIDEQYITIDGNFGRLVLGSENSAAYQMQLRPRTVGIGYGEIEEWVVEASGASGSGDSAIEDLRLRFEDNDSDKITYYTPRIAGFQLGVSYVPNAEQDMNGSIATIDEVYGNGVAVGLNFKRKFDGFSIGVAGGYTTWLTQPINHPGANPEGFSAGVELGVGALTFNGGYIYFNNLFDGAGDFTDDAQDGYGYGFGVRYKTGPYQFGALYHHGVVEGKTNIDGEDRSDLVFLSAQRRLGPGVRISLSAFWADWVGEEPGVDDDNDGYGVVTEVRLDF